MTCPQCGTENQAGFKFCVKCGSNLEKSQDIDIDKVSMGGYHSEDEPQSGGFKLSGGTFKINDNPPESSSSDFYSSDELNDTDEEFDLSGFDFDEPFIPKLDTGRVALPEKTVCSQANSFAQSAGSMFDNPVGTSPPPPPKTLGSMFDEPSGTLPPPKSIGDYPDDYEDDDVPPSAAASPQNMIGGMPNQPMGAIPKPQTIGGMPAQTMGGTPTQTMGAQTLGSMPAQTLGGMPTQTMGAQTLGGMPTQTMGGMPNQAMGANIQPQIIGYDQSGMPIYGQPQMMFAQPQIIGYDQSGMPIYGQPQMMFAQPQIIGYDQSGMPVYGQPQMMFAQPQIIGYDQNGMPVYAQVQPMMPQQAIGGMPAPARPEPEPQIPVEDDEKVEVPDNFWEFFDGGKATEHAEPADDDFFGRRSSDMGGLSSSDFENGRLKKAERKKNLYMSDTPLVDGSKLAKRDDAKYNKLYMKNTETVNADDLQAKKTEAPQDFMGHTRDVDASKLKAYKRGKAWSMMGNTQEADANDLEAFVPKHKESIMGQADHAVESMPKKKVRTYNDEIDSIELPDYMKARKTVKKDTPEIPGLPEL